VVIHVLREQIPTSREESMRFVDDVFLELIEEAYEAAGMPDLSDLLQVWNVFSAILIHIPDCPL
jgi:hypothetical protein